MHTHWYELAQYLKLSGAQIRQDTNPVEICNFYNCLFLFSILKILGYNSKTWKSLINCSTGLGPDRGHPELPPPKSLPSAGLI